MKKFPPVRITRNAHLPLALILVVLAFLALYASLPNNNVVPEQKQTKTVPSASSTLATAGKLKNEIACPTYFSDIRDIPLYPIKTEMLYDGSLSGFSRNSVPYFDSILSQQCFDLNHDGNPEYLFKLRIRDLVDNEEYRDRFIPQNYTGGPQDDSILLAFMDKDWNIIWLDQYYDELAGEQDPEIGNGKQDDSIRIGNFYLMLDGNTVRLDIDGGFRNVSVSEKDFGEAIDSADRFGDYYTEIYRGSEGKNNISATRIWKKEGAKFKFITDIPAGEYQDIDHYLFSAYADDTGHDILYLYNTPGDSACTVGLTRLDTSSGKLSIPEFVEDYGYCDAVSSPDGKRAVVDGINGIAVYDLPAEKSFAVPDPNLGEGLYVEEYYPAASRGNEAVMVWLDNDTFSFDVFRENEKKEEMDLCRDPDLEDQRRRQGIQDPNRA